MIIASDVRNGMTIRLEGNLYKVITAEYKAGTAKMGSLVHLKLKNITTGSFTERRFHPEDRLEDIELASIPMEFIYQDGDDYYFMHPISYEQYPINKSLLGNFVKFITPGIKLRIEFYEEQPVHVIIPKTVDLKVISTGAGVKGETDAAYKPAQLENGLEVLVPQFIKSGDIIRIEVETEKYLERVKTETA
ncbi:MAG: elongation factor P [candidate division WOR-3 bacterium]|nr:elongation factor P [candidate division WOR-3 bacterium]